MTTLEGLDEISRITFLGPIWVVYSLVLAVVSCLDNLFGCWVVFGIVGFELGLGVNSVFCVLLFLFSFFLLRTFIIIKSRALFYERFASILICDVCFYCVWFIG